MPNLNGLELYTRIRELDPTAKALLLTANHEQFTEGKQKVGKDYLRVITKPISNDIGG
jgi:CheY-like chemotaxis protein